MNLKEAFRFQNKLQSMMETAEDILGREQNITRVQNTYLRRKVMAEAEDETTFAPPATEYSEQITEAAAFLLFLLAQRETLSAAIYRAKAAPRPACRTGRRGGAQRQTAGDRRSAAAHGRPARLRDAHRRRRHRLPLQQRGQSGHLSLRCPARGHHQLRPEQGAEDVRRPEPPRWTRRWSTRRWTTPRPLT